MTYDEQVVSFAQLTAIFWYNVDPLNGNGQFCDNGHSYLSVLFYYTTEEQVIALGTFAVPRSAARDVDGGGPWWTTVALHSTWVTTIRRGRGSRAPVFAHHTTTSLQS